MSKSKELMDWIEEKIDEQFVWNLAKAITATIFFITGVIIGKVFWD